MSAHPTIAAALGAVRRHLHGLEGAHILVACSGGPDSVALLGLLAKLRHGLGLTLSVGHVDHGLRAASADEARLVASIAGALGAAYYATRLDLRSGPGLPARARSARRTALSSLAVGACAEHIALGHTATDQAETVLMHLARGAGLTGMAAMAPRQPRQSRPGGWWLRPLLDQSRGRCRELAARLGLPFVDDPTNLDLAHPRVAVRREVLPVLGRFWPKAETAMAQSAARAREAHEALDWTVEREMQARRRARGWSLETFAELPTAIRTLWLRGVCAREGVEMSALGHRTILAIDRFCCSEAGGRRGWDLRPGRRLWIEGDQLWFTASTT